MEDWKAAILSDCGTYRFTLYRQWDVGKNIKKCLFVMLNPSTADAEKDDPTINKCIKIAKYNGCGRMEVVNIFAWRTSNPKELIKAKINGSLVVGIGNYEHIRSAGFQSDLIIVAWGNNAYHPELIEMSIVLSSDLKILFGEKTLKCLGYTNSGAPIHPLARGKNFVRHDVKLLSYN